MALAWTFHTIFLRNKSYQSKTRLRQVCCSNHAVFQIARENILDGLGMGAPAGADHDIWAPDCDAAAGRSGCRCGLSASTSSFPASPSRCAHPLPLEAKQPRLRRFLRDVRDSPPRSQTPWSGATEPTHAVRMTTPIPCARARSGVGGGGQRCTRSGSAPCPAGGRWVEIWTSPACE